MATNCVQLLSVGIIGEPFPTCLRRFSLYLELNRIILSNIIYLEKDIHGGTLWVWSYPTISESDRELLTKKCQLVWENQRDLTDLVYSQHQNNWYYIQSTDQKSDKLPQVNIVSLVLMTRDFHPEKYTCLSQHLLSRYLQSGSPLTLLESYLSAFTQGTCPISDGDTQTFNVQDFDSRHAYISASIKDVVIQFGIETILIYTAVLLKKRIAVYHSKLRPLLAFTRALPALVWHRQDWSFLYPWLELDDKELDNLHARSTYIAGFTNPNVVERSDIYDILVNLTTSEITIAKHAKDTFSMGKLHKDIAMFMVHCVDDSDRSPQQIIKEIAGKTKELLNNLQSLAVEDNEGRRGITLEALRDRKMPPATESFLYNLAAAEGLITV